MTTRRTTKDAKHAELENVGIDPKRLSAAFAEVDEQGDGELELFEFREFWGMVFPDRPMTEATWKYTESMFREIDIDCSNCISFEEIVSFLNKSLDVERERARRPKTFFDWCYIFCTDTATTWVTPSDFAVSILIPLVRMLEHVMVLISIVALMVDSLPKYQQNSDSDNLRGTKATFVLQSICVGFFCVHFVLWTLGCLLAQLRLMPVEAVATASPTASAQVADRPADGGLMVRVADYFTSVDLFVNLGSIVPYFVTLGDPAFYHLLPIISFRLCRLIRVLKWVSISGAQKAPELGPALMKSMMSLWFLLMLILISMCLSASFMFYAETDQATFNYTAQQWIRNIDSMYTDAGSVTRFQSIPDSLWWSVVTLTTVGYGDTFPTTIGGKCVATMTMLGGLIVVGYPITILTGTFQAMEEERLDREMRLDRNRELYNGIRCWLASAEHELGGSQQSPEAFNVVDHRSGNTFASGVKKRKDVIEEALSAMSLRITDRLQSLSDRVARLEVKQKKANHKSAHYLKSMKSLVGSTGGSTSLRNGENSGYSASIGVLPPAIKPISPPDTSHHPLDPRSASISDVPVDVPHSEESSSSKGDDGGEQTE